MGEKTFWTKYAKWSIAAMVGLYVISVLVNLGVMELEGEEPRRAVVSLEMMHSGAYFNPTLFGWPYYNKPPVFNWILIGFIKSSGSSSEAVLRLPSLFFYILWAAIHYQFARRFFSKGAALLSAFFLLTSADIYFYGLANGAEIDIFYSFVVYLQAIAIFHFYLQQKWWALYLVSYALCAVGFLTKGFPSLVFEGFTLMALCMYAKSLKPLFKWQHAAGIALFAALAGLYFWGYSFRGNVQHLLVNFLNESLVKSAIGERSHKVFEKAVGYPVLLLKLMAPWSLLLLLLFVKKIRQRVWSNPFGCFSILFIACNLWIYWLTGQPKARYIYMFVPFVTVIFVQLYQSFVAENAARFDGIMRWFGIVFLLAAIGVLASAFLTGHMLAACIVAALALGWFAWQYWRVAAALRIWAFVGGVIFLRLVYAVIFIPLQGKETAYYEQPVKRAAAAFEKSSLTYWAPPQPFVVAIDTKVFSWKADTLQVPPHIHPQIPYYYYRHTGHLMRYDSTLVPGRAYISFAKNVANKPVDTVYLFSDKHKSESLIFYRLQTATRP